MKKVVLLGDSIRQIGYGTVLPDMLKDEFDVWQPSDNCRFAQYTLRGLFDWREKIDAAEIVHFNVGHWDLCDIFGDGSFTPIEDYVKTTVRIAKLLLAKGKTVIFATTCPVREGRSYNSNDTIRQFNAAIVPELEKMGVLINDMHTPVAADVDRYIREDDKIHLSEDGIRLCAQLTADSIRKAAEIQK